MLYRRGTRDSLCQASLCTAYYQGTQCSRLCRTHAEPVCSIKWMRRHDTFPSCRPRYKLRSPFSYVAGDATSYVWHRPDKAAPGHDERGTPRAGKESRRVIFFAFDAIMYEQYVILYCIVGPTCRGPNGCVRAPLRYKREAHAVHREISGQTKALTTLSLSWEGNTTHSGRRVLRSGGPNHSKSCCVHRVLE